jgi:hypothetical protein
MNIKESLIALLFCGLSIPLVLILAAAFSFGRASPAAAKTAIWLVIRLYQPDVPPIQLEDSQQPDLPTCWVHASEAVERAAKVAGEIRVRGVVRGP